MSKMRILVTGGAGFIGSAVCRRLVLQTGAAVINVDKLTYAADLASLASIEGLGSYAFLQSDICDRQVMDLAFADYEPDAIIHLAAESHVDRSIAGPEAFVSTNIVGTYTLLEAARIYYERLPLPRRKQFRFIHVSTDEVYGSLGAGGLVSRGHALQAEFAVFGEQGGLGPPRARVVQNLRTASHRIELFEQLRTVPVPGKAHPVDDPQCDRPEATTGLWRRRKYSRLASRR
ncbi:nucleoside-diphosphate-sugar epimerase [Bradyrhizobium sp. LB7.1]